MIHHHHAQTLPAGQIRMPGKLLKSIGGSFLESAEGLCDPAVEEQLRCYMTRERCRAGLMFNGREAMWLSAEGGYSPDCWNREALSDLSEMEERLQDATAQTALHAVNCHEIFRQASAGDLDACCSLVSLVGSDTRLTFVLSLWTRGHLSRVQAFGLRTDRDGMITYRTRGVVTRTRQEFARRNFHSLLALLPLWLL
jgi:hypothetical protein